MPLAGVSRGAIGATVGVRWPARRWKMAVSPDSRWLATGGSDGTVRIWDAAADQARAVMRIDNMIFACACPTSTR